MNPNDRQALIDALRIQMAVAGVTPEELAGGAPASRLPTVKDAVANIKQRNRYSDNTVRTYTTGWDLFVAAHGDVALDRLTFEDIERVADRAQTAAAERWERRNAARREADRRTYDHDGQGAFESCVRAIRALYTREYKKAGLPVEQSPAHQVDIPSRRPNARRALTRPELALAFEVAASGGDDPVLDTLILRSGYETGARQEGLINLRLMDLNRSRQTVMLDEKFGKRREQPVTAELLDALEGLARDRGALVGEDHVLRYKPRGGRSGGRLTSRRFDTLVERVRDGDPTLAELHFVYHLMRYTIGRRIERVAGKAVARRSLGHAPKGGDVTDTYTRTLDGETAAAWSMVMGQPHPLAEDYDPTW